MLDFIRIACAVPKVRVADVKTNTAEICRFIAQAEEKGTDILVFPELALTGCSCGDLFFQASLQKAALGGLKQILSCCAAYPAVTAVVGLPLAVDGSLYNCAAVISGGALCSIHVKTFLPDYGAFSERRWFAPAACLRRDEITLSELGIPGDAVIPIGSNLITRLGDGTGLGVEIGEDLFAPVAPSAILSLSGAEVIANPAASNALAGKRLERREKLLAQSAACTCIYAFVSAGCTESTQDLVYSGHAMLAQCGKLLCENGAEIAADYMDVCDADLGQVRGLRQRNTTFRDCADLFASSRICEGSDMPLRSDGSLYSVSKLPFIPETKQARQDWCRSIFRIQAAGLAQRLDTIKANAVIGISGGLDSTLALLVAVEAIRMLNRPHTDVHGITMPCFGTSDRTYHNSWELMRRLGISSKEISIRDAVTQHFADIGHDPSVHNTTYENAQARERTQILMDYAGRVGGIVVGTGDLSELALGWCTYNGDHMSMYGVNGTVPKTLIRWIIEAVADDPAFAAAKDTLLDVLDTPISPELLPPDAQGKISQQTEDIVGPYALHDFFIYYMVRYGYTPTKIYTLACRAFKDDFDSATVKKWLVNFYRRFFTQQFKRNCQPDGVKTGIVGLGPRGDWKMPSDASCRIWLEEAESL